MHNIVDPIVKENLSDPPQVRDDWLMAPTQGGNLLDPLYTKMRRTYHEKEFVSLYGMG